MAYLKPVWVELLPTVRARTLVGQHEASKLILNHTVRSEYHVCPFEGLNVRLATFGSMIDCHAHRARRGETRNLLTPLDQRHHRADYQRCAAVLLVWRRRDGSRGGLAGAASAASLVGLGGLRE